MRRRRRSDDTPSVLLPDTWPKNGIRRQDDLDASEEHLLARPCVRGVSLIRVTLISRDPLAAESIKCMLINEKPIRLRTLYDIPETESLVGQDVVIWVRMNHDGMPDLAGRVAWLCRNCQEIKQLILSDALPSGVRPGQAPLSGVWIARGCESREMIYALLLRVIFSPRPIGPMLTHRLGRMQWRVLLLRATGAHTEVIARFCGISVKTVSVHETAIRERLGISNMSEYAWLIRSVAQMQKAVPALSRGVRGLKKKGGQ